MLHSKPIIVFVRPRARGNIGALARVMSNFGVAELRFVQNPKGADAFTQEQSPVDWAMACRGEHVLQNAKTFPTLAEALSDVHWALGTTARPRETDTGYTRPFKEYDSLLKEKKLDGKNWALILGTEDDGLSDEELSLCNVVTTIDTDSASPSMNVAMAAGVLLYHWNLLRRTKVVEEKKPAKDLATTGDLDKLARYIFETSKLSEFVKYPDEVAVLARIRRVFQKDNDLNRGDILFIFEIFYQLKSKIMGKHGERNFLS